MEANNFIHILTKIDSNVTHVRGLDRLEYHSISSHTTNSFNFSKVRPFHIAYHLAMPKNTVGDFVRNEKYPNRK